LIHALLARVPGLSRFHRVFSLILLGMVPGLAPARRRDPYAVLLQVGGVGGCLVLALCLSWTQGFAWTWLLLDAAWCACALFEIRRALPLAEPRRTLAALLWAWLPVLAVHAASLVVVAALWSLIRIPVVTGSLTPGSYLLTSRGLEHLVPGHVVAIDDARWIRVAKVVDVPPTVPEGSIRVHTTFQMDYAEPADDTVPVPLARVRGRIFYQWSPLLDRGPLPLK